MRAVLIAAGVAVVVFALLFLFLWLSVRRGHQVGNRGFEQRSRLTCPKCQETFDYDFYPGVSLTAIRLGMGRYMACPVCHKWSYFDLYHTRIARTAAGPPAS